MKLNLKYNIPLFIYSLITGRKIYYCKQDINKISNELLSNNKRSIISEWKIGIHSFENIYTTPNTNDSEYHKQSILTLVPILKKIKYNIHNKIDQLVDKTFENNEVTPDNITELLIRICDINNNNDECNIKFFSKIGYRVMEYINYRNTFYTLFFYLLGVCFF